MRNFISVSLAAELMTSISSTAILNSLTVDSSFLKAFKIRKLPPGDGANIVGVVDGVVKIGRFNAQVIVWHLPSCNIVQRGKSLGLRRSLFTTFMHDQFGTSYIYRYYKSSQEKN